MELTNTTKQKENTKKRLTAYREALEKALHTNRSEKKGENA